MLKPGLVPAEKLFVAMLALGVMSCSSSSTDGPSSAAASGSAAKGPTARPLAPPPVTRPVADPNPLGLPARTLDVQNGSKAFVVPEPMLRGARPGSSMILRSATIVGKEGENLVVDGRDGPDYPLHPGYVIPLVPAKRIRPNQPVIAEWAQTLRHGIARRYLKDKVVVRFTDTPDKSDRTLDLSQVMPATDGFHPGNYAALRQGSELEHVLLVSPVKGEAKDAPEWLVIGYAGAARVVRTDALLGVPISYEPKVGTVALVEHLGKMREGIIKELDRPGLMTVKFDRAGRSVQTGWGMVMPLVVSK